MCSYRVDVGYDFVEDKHNIYNFTSEQDAREFANEYFKLTGELLSIERIE